MKIKEEDMGLMLLNSLPESYHNLVTTLMWGKETLEVEEITSALLTLIQRRIASDGSSYGKGFVVKINQECGRNKSQGESSRNKSQSKSRRMKDIHYYKCGKNGHIKRECLKWKKENTLNKEGSSKSVNVVEEGNLESGDGDMLLVSSS